MASDSGIGRPEVHTYGSKVWDALEKVHLQNGSFDNEPEALASHFMRSQSSSEQWMSGDRGKVVAASVLVWTFLYFAGRALLPFSATYGKWDNERQYKARGLVPSSVFLLGIVPVSVWALWADAELEHTRVRGSTPVSHLITAVATGYFIYDCAVVLYHFKQDGMAYLVHGVLCMVTYGIASAYEVYHYYAPTFLLFEVTTLFVNLRWVLVELELKDSPLYMCNGVALLASWFVVRILWGYCSSYLFWVDSLAALSEGALPVPVVGWYMLANVSLNTLNTLWFSKIVKGAIKVLKGCKQD